MRTVVDEDEFETVHTSQRCTACGGDPRKCNGGCNASYGISLRRRSPEEVARIKAERQREHEDAVLAEADAIRRRRAA